MLGMIEGNGHPYSWSALINGYKRDTLTDCPYPSIREYMGRHDPETVGISGAQVTHVWTDDPADAPTVAAVGLIPNIVSRPEDVIGHVDAVIIATDDGNDHVRRARAFIEAGLPVFIDKPMATNLTDLRQLIEWQSSGSAILSTSGMRYAPELHLSAEQKEKMGDLRWIHACSIKTWERYGIHALESTHPFLGSGYTSVRASTDAAGDLMFITHRSGVRVTLGTFYDAMGCAGAMELYGSKGNLPIKFSDIYTTFRRQLVAFIEFLRTGTRPLPFAETVELMAVIIAGIRSREQDGAVIQVADILSELPS